MTTTDHNALTWVTAGSTTTVDALVLRFGAVLNGLFDRVLHEGCDWFLVDQSGHLIDCSAEAVGATGLLGAPLGQLVGGVAAESMDEAWNQVLVGRAQTVWPWHGGRAKAAMRSIELHPIRDVMSDAAPVIGALVVIVDAQSRTGSLSAAA